MKTKTLMLLLMTSCYTNGDAICLDWWGGGDNCDFGESEESGGDVHEIDPCPMIYGAVFANHPTHWEGWYPSYGSVNHTGVWPLVLSGPEDLATVDAVMSWGAAAQGGGELTLGWDWEPPWVGSWEPPIGSTASIDPVGLTAGEDSSIVWIMKHTMSPAIGIGETDDASLATWLMVDPYSAAYSTSWHSDWSPSSDFGVVEVPGFDGVKVFATEYPITTTEAMDSSEWRFESPAPAVRARVVSDIGVQAAPSNADWQHTSTESKGAQPVTGWCVFSRDPSDIGGLDSSDG